jgi:DNA topoisomerase-2
MTVLGEPEVQPYSGKDYTIVTFYPEFKRFGMKAFDEDIISLMQKRVFDMAGLLSSVKVSLN